MRSRLLAYFVLEPRHLFSKFKNLKNNSVMDENLSGLKVKSNFFMIYLVTIGKMMKLKDEKWRIQLGVCNIPIGEVEKFWISMYHQGPLLSFLFLQSERCRLESVQDFLIKLDMKPCMHLVEISILSQNIVNIRLTKIMNRADKNWAQF